MTPNKPLIRLASRIHQELLRATKEPLLPMLPESSWQDAQRWLGYLRMAQERGWTGAVKAARDELLFALKSLVSQSETALELLQAKPASSSVVPMRDIYEELVALEQEFDELEWDWKKGTLSVATEPIELEEIDLGPFEIRLDWRQMDSSMPYCVIAKQEHAAECDSSVTHPHVSSERLCEGDGRVPIRQALQQGRLCDFFLLVRQVLQTYNAGSAYVKLQNWFGSRCQDCGHDCDETVVCEGCENDICDDCCSWCSNCDHRCCSECCGRCHGCRRIHCHSCLSACADCSEDFCEECLTDGCCSECRKAATDTDEDSANAASSDAGGQTPGVAVHADRLGEALVSA